MQIHQINIIQDQLEEEQKNDQNKDNWGRNGGHDWNRNDRYQCSQEQFQMKQIQINQNQSLSSDSSYGNQLQNILQVQKQVYLSDPSYSSHLQSDQIYLSGKKYSQINQSQINKHNQFTDLENNLRPIKELSLAQIIKQGCLVTQSISQKHLNSSILSVKYQLYIITYINHAIQQNFYPQLLKLIENSSIHHSTSQTFSTFISCAFFFFTCQFATLCKNSSSTNSTKMQGLSKRIQALKSVISKTIDFIIFVIYSPVICLFFSQIGFIHLYYFILIISTIYKTIQLVFYWTIFFILVQKNQQSNPNNKHHPHVFIQKVIQLALHENNNFQNRPFFYLGIQKNKIELIINSIISCIQLTSESSMGKENQLNSKKDQESQETKLKKISQLVLEIFNSQYVDKLRQLLPDVNSDFQKINQLNSHHLILLKKIPKSFKQIEEAFYHELFQQVVSLFEKENKGLTIYLNNSKKLLSLCQAYIKYQSIVNQIFVELQKIAFLNKIRFDSQQLQKKQTTSQPQLSQSLNKLSKQTNLILLSKNLAKVSQIINFSKKTVSPDQVQFMNQLYEFYEVFLEVIRLKLNQMQWSQQELCSFLNYIEESISIKVFLLNSRKSSITNKSFTVFKQKNSHEKSFLTNHQKEEQYVTQNSRIYPSVLLSVTQTKPSQYLKINYQVTNESLTQQHLIVYEEFSKEKNTIQKLDQLIEKLVEKKNNPNELNEQKIINSFNDIDNDDDSFQSSHKKQEISSSDEQEIPFFNKPLNPFYLNQQNSTKQKIFSKSQFQFNFDVQHQMSQLFSQLKQKQSPSNEKEEIKQYQ